MRHKWPINEEGGNGLMILQVRPSPIHSLYPGGWRTSAFYTNQCSATVLLGSQAGHYVYYTVVVDWFIRIFESPICKGWSKADEAFPLYIRSHSG